MSNLPDPSEEDFEVSKIEVIKYIDKTTGKLGLKTTYSEDLGLIDALGMLSMSQHYAPQDFEEGDDES